jgi:hypothetical protein
MNGVRFDGVDLFLCDPHVSIDSTDEEIRRLADRIRARRLVVGSLVAPVWRRPAAAPRWAMRQKP